MGTFRIVVFGMVFALWAGTASSATRLAVESGDPLEHFYAAVAKYEALRVAVEQTVPSLDASPKFGDRGLASAAIAAAIREARPFAAEGDIFDARAQVVLRQRIGESLHEPGCGAAEILAAARDDDARFRPPRPIVHDRFDWWFGSVMPWCMVSLLPGLPDSLEFRLVERDLVLLDVNAALVVDVLPDALPVSESWRGMRYAHGRDANRDAVSRRVEVPR